MAIRNRDDVLEHIRQIACKHLQHLPVKVYLYGSWARQEERITSDVDLAIWSESQLPSGMLTRLRSALEESTIPYLVEVVELHTADEAFVKQVLKEGIEWKGCGSV